MHHFAIIPHLELLLETTNSKKQINEEHLWLFSPHGNSVIVCFVLGNGTGLSAVLIYVYNIRDGCVTYLLC